MVIVQGKIKLDPGEQLPDALKQKYVLVNDWYEPVFPECQHHSRHLKILCCKREIQDHYCKKKGIFISPTICQKCVTRGENG